jgi:hypothetical protein
MSVVNAGTTFMKYVVSNNRIGSIPVIFAMATSLIMSAVL